MEPLRQNATVRPRACLRTRCREPGCRLLIQTRYQPRRQDPLKLNDQIPDHYIEIDLAAKTQKQGDDEDDYDPEQQQQPETSDPLNNNNLVQSTPLTTSLR